MMEDHPSDYMREMMRHAKHGPPLCDECRVPMEYVPVKPMSPVCEWKCPDCGGTDKAPET